MADTHAIIWMLDDDPRLSNEARRVFQNTVESAGRICLSAVSIVEVIYLVEKGRIARASWQKLDSVVREIDGFLSVVPIDAEVARSVERIRPSEIPDMPDRIIAATALTLEVPLITRDRRIRSSTIATIW